MQKRMMSVLLTLAMLFTMTVPAFAGDENPWAGVTDYVYTNSQGVANTAITVPASGGKVELYTQIPAGTYNFGASGTTGFDFSELTDGVKGEIEGTVDPYGNEEDEAFYGFAYTSGVMAVKRDGTTDGSTSRFRPYKVWTYNPYDYGSFTITEPKTVVRATLTFPAGLTPGATYNVYVTMLREIYYEGGKDNTVFFYGKDCPITDPTWVITVADGSTVNAKDVVWETGIQPTAADIIERSQVTGTLPDGSTKPSFTQDDFDTAEWTALKQAAGAGKIGDYPLTIKSGTAEKTINVKLVSDLIWVDEDNYLYANDFVLQNKNEEDVTLEDVIKASGATCVVAGEPVTLTEDNFEGLTELLAAANSDKTGDYPLTVSEDDQYGDEMSVAITGTLMDHVAPPDGGDDSDPDDGHDYILAGNDFDLTDDTNPEDVVPAWIIDQADVIVLDNGEELPVVDEDGNLLPGLVVNPEDLAALVDALEEEDYGPHDVRITYDDDGDEGTPPLQITIIVTIVEGDKSEISAIDIVAEVGEITTIDQYVEAAQVSGKDKSGAAITSWTADNFDGLDRVLTASAANVYHVTVKPYADAPADKCITVTVELRSQDSGNDPDQPQDTKGRVWANDVTLETGVADYDEAKLIADTKAGGEDKSGAAAALIVTDTNGVIAAMKAGKTGKYEVKFAVADGASVTVTVTLVDHKEQTEDGDGEADENGYTLTANDFSIGTGTGTTEPAGDLTAKDVLELSEAALSEYNGTVIDLLPDDDVNPYITVSGLDELNDAKAAGLYGDDYEITITYDDPTDDVDPISVTIKVTLNQVRYRYDWNNNGRIDSNDVSVMVAIQGNLQLTDDETEEAAWMCILDGDGNGFITANDISDAVAMNGMLTDMVYVQVPYAYLAYLVK